MRGLNENAPRRLRAATNKNSGLPADARQEITNYVGALRTSGCQKRPCPRRSAQCALCVQVVGDSTAIPELSALALNGGVFACQTLLATTLPNRRKYRNGEIERPGQKCRIHHGSCPNDASSVLWRFWRSLGINRRRRRIHGRLNRDRNDKVEHRLCDTRHHGSRREPRNWRHGAHRRNAGRR